MLKAEVSAASKPKSMFHKVKKYSIDDFLNGTSFNKPVISALPALATKSHRMDKATEGLSGLKRGGGAMFCGPERKKVKKHQVRKIYVGSSSHLGHPCVVVYRVQNKTLMLGQFQSIT